MGAAAVWQDNPVSVCRGHPPLGLLTPGLFHLRRGGGRGAEGRAARRRVRQTLQRQAAQVQGPLLQETQVLRRLRPHDCLCAPLSAYPAADAAPLCVFLIPIRPCAPLLSEQQVCAEMQELQNQHPPPVPLLRGVPEVFWQNCEKCSVTQLITHCGLSLDIVSSLFAESLCVRLSSLRGSDGPTALLCTAASRTPLCPSCCPSVSPAQTHRNPKSFVRFEWQKPQSAHRLVTSLCHSVMLWFQQHTTTGSPKAATLKSPVFKLFLLVFHN